MRKGAGGTVGGEGSGEGRTQELGSFASSSCAITDMPSEALCDEFTTKIEKGYVDGDDN